jgi:hypothetical protein
MERHGSRHGSFWLCHGGKSWSLEIAQKVNVTYQERKIEERRYGN